MIEIIETRNKLRTEALWSLCNKENWFTCGTNSQYEKMFDLNRNGASIEELALVIWICSDDVDREYVLRRLEEAIK